MNIERLKAEAERLRNWDKVNPDIEFDMGQYYESNDLCGTCCCIAGDIAIMQGILNDDFRGGIHSCAREYLDLTAKQANWLFLAEWADDSDERYLEQITLEEAASSIDYMIAHREEFED